jgi:ParB-like nuclease domain
MQKKKTVKAAAVGSSKPKSNVKKVAATNQLQLVALRSIHSAQIHDPSDKSNLQLFESISAIGPKTPLSVSPRLDGDFDLIVGVRRYWIMKELGIEFVDCFVIDDPKAAALWKISENLHRNDLSAMDRSQAIRDWNSWLNKPGQDGQVFAGGRGNLGGLAAASRATGISRQELRRAIKISAIETEAKDAIRSAGLSDNQARLLQIASVEPSEQLKKVTEIIAGRKPKVVPTSNPEAREFKTIQRAWEHARPSVRSRFIKDVVAPYMLTEGE